MSFSNTVQLGIPVVTAVFGNPGLTLLIAIISLQSLVLLTTGTVLAEADLARGASAWRTVGTTVAYWGAGLRGLPLTIAVLCAALPIGANVLLFAQRYHVIDAGTTAAIVASTLGFVVTSAVWLSLVTP
jgi:predicted permease